MKIAILAGGVGKRLWPLSRTSYPKQFLKLGSDKTLLQQTILRNLCLVQPKDLFILTSKEFYHEVSELVSEIDTTLVENIVLEPSSKNTAVACAYFVSLLKEKGVDPHEVILISPADHVIAPHEHYTLALKRGEEHAKKGHLVTFGIVPTKPETGYGYIQVDGERVKRFVEKPDEKTANEYLKRGDFLWNSGMFIFTLKTIEQELKEHANMGSFFEQDKEVAFENAASISLDYALMEKTKNLYCVPLNASWSDVGAWDSVYELLEKDQNANVLSGEVFPLDTKNCLLFSEKGLLATVGLDDVLVIATGDSVLVTKKSEAQRVKELVDELKKRGRAEVDEHKTTKRPWGSYTILGEGSRYKIKRIEVKPLAKLSLQLHYHRSEHWVVVSGTAKVTINDRQTIVHEGESIFVPKSSIHRVENPGKVALEIIEVQVGEYLGEDDIVRLEDIYGRLKEEGAFSVLLHKSSI